MPGALEKYSCWLPRHRKSVGLARQLFGDFIAERMSGEPYLSDGELVLSELVTNAVMHAATPPGRLIYIQFELSSDVLRIEVHDADPTHPTLQPAAECDEAGRGLLLVSQLSTSWGCYPRESGIGKAVWALVGGAR
ncbi:ATP-binding protein [Kitasatospora sp. NPDC004669]|uniref:ATP-binding protein n=1 Tax=Kitasatospora sp. NPDC004669 TaxID=3154555 RepID=UPI0033A390B0